MAIQLFATSGSHLYIGQVLNWAGVPWTVASFAGASWIELPWVEDLGTFGDVFAEITFDAISQQRTEKLKGSRNAGNMTITMANDHTSFGQSALRTAADDAVNDYMFRVQFNDAATGGTPSFRYFTAKVMQASQVLGTANNVVKFQTVLGITSNIVRVDAIP